ncbi:MAG: MucBP domain-containing protein [Clostridia bacterium]|nr:MucBP domain-containing protein [Clostridia bacterium]
MELTKKRIIQITAIILSVITILFIFAFQKVNKKVLSLDPETARSMNYTQITDEDSKIENTDFVKFSAFFTRDLNQDGNAEKLLGTCKRVFDTDTLYMDINVLTNGYLKNGRIEINGENFNYEMNMVKDSVLKNNYVSDDVKLIELNQINAGTQKLIIGNVNSNIENDINNYSKINSITLTGIHVSDEGIETPINKTVNITVDWYGETKTELYRKYQATTFYYNYDNLESKTISFNFRLDEMQEELLLKENVVKIVIPNLNGYEPTDVKCINGNITSEYDKSKKELIIKRSSTCNDEGIISSKLSSSNSYTINLTYPKESYETISSYMTLTIPITGYYVGYNNQNKEFQNPYISNIETGDITLVFRETPKGEIYNFYVDFEGKVSVQQPAYAEEETERRYVMSKQDILNLYDNYDEENLETIKNKEYIVRWMATRGPEGVVPSMIMSETKEENVTDNTYGDKWNNTVINEYTDNTGIYFYNADKVLEESGSISVYDNETNELIHTFTKDEWNKYTKDNPYKYEEPIKHIRVETSKTNTNSSLSIYNVKELNIKKIMQNFTKEDIKDIEIMYSYVTGICNIEGQEPGIRKDIDYVYLVSEKSNSKITVETKKIFTQEILNNQKIFIKASATQEGEAKWQNGEFLVELPEEIINTEINTISTNSTNVEIVAYDLFKKDDKYFIKIITKNDNPDSYIITIDCNMVPDPRTSTSDKKIKLYSYNQNCNDYYYEEEDKYDVDSDNNFSEKVGASAATLNLLSPTSLITLETVSDYNNENEITIAPNIATVKKETRQATINIELTNNYPNTVSGVQLLGKIPFEGNKYVLNDRELNSKFNTIMTQDGVNIPEEFKEKSVVYYSENENPSKDLLDSNNGWKVKNEVQDFSKIKTYLIDLSQYEIQIGKKYTFNYKINIPENLEYNLVSYSTHAIYYELNTEGGKLQLSTEPNKVGIKIVRKYELDLNKCKEGFSSHGVEGATYSVEYLDEESNNVTRILTTDSDGYVNMKNLYIGVTYTVKELKSPENYELNNQIISFNVEEDESGNLQLQTNSNKVTLNKNDEKVQIHTEDTPKVDIVITKRNVATGEPIPNITFNLEGKKYTTNSNGKIYINQLLQNHEYTLTESKTEGYYQLDEIKFRVIKNEAGNIQIESDNNAFVNAVIHNNEVEDCIKIDIVVENEKIPTYNLQILKVEENSKENDISNLKPLQNAKFNFKYIDLNKEKIFTTDDKGIINILNLYQFVEGKTVTAEYELQEVQSPDGYANNGEKIKFKAIKNEENGLQIQIENENDLNTIKDIQIENDNVKIIIQNKPLFNLLKTDFKTGKPLANAQFVIYETDGNKTEIDYAKDIYNNYVGVQNENGQYIVTTDKDGKITLPLKGGLYKIVEVNYPEGYQDDGNVEYFKVVGAEELKPQIPSDEENDTYEIYNIEDLVKLSYMGIKTSKIKLMNNLNFNDNNSYVNPEDRSYGDLNEDGKIVGIKEELTDINASGFKPIEYFSGIFDGQGYEIKNIFINRENASLFLEVKNAEIKNTGITGVIKGHNHAAGFVNDMSDSIIKNCHNATNISNDNTTISLASAGGIVAILYNSKAINCYNSGYIYGESYSGGISGYMFGDSAIYDCYNLGYINGQKGSAGGITGGMGIFTGGTISTSGTKNINESFVIVNCYNRGNVYGKISAGGIAGFVQGKRVNGRYVNYLNIINSCYNIGNVSGTVNTGTIIGGKPNQTNYNNYITLNKCYYLSSISLNGTNIIDLGISVDRSYMKSGNFINDLDSKHWYLDTSNKNTGYPIIKNDFEDIKINNVEDLVNLSQEVSKHHSYYGQNIVLEKSIDFEDDLSYANPSDTSFGDLNGDGVIEGIKQELTNKNGYGFTPIGRTYGKYFSGTFDGQGNEIKNLYINSDNDVIGLFGDVRKGSIKNLGLICDITGGKYTGGITGHIYDGNIENCYVIGKISGGECTGGIVGFSGLSNINNSFNTANISNNDSIKTGGIAGNISYGSVNNSYNTGKISGSSNVGGIVGYQYEANIMKCYNSGDISGTDKVGGLVGLIDYKSSIVSSYNTGNINATGNYVGGIIGYIDNRLNTIENCYNIGIISGVDFVGGLIGYTKSSENIILCNYNIGAINGTNNVGGIFAYVDDSVNLIKNNYYSESIEIIGNDIFELGDKKSNDYMKTDLFVNDLGYAWQIDTDSKNNGYPTIKTTCDYIENINCIEDLVVLSKTVNAYNTYENITVTLEKNLDFEDDSSYKDPQDTSFGDLNGDGIIEGIKQELINKNSGYGFTPIGTKKGNCFSGIFNGNGYEIRNLYISKQKDAGLFGYITNATIKNLGLIGNMQSNTYAGAIARNATNSIIKNCYTEVNFYNHDNVGGIVYYADNSEIRNCYNEGEMSNNKNAGGIINASSNNSSINNSYDIGEKNNEKSFVLPSSNCIINNCYYLNNIDCEDVKGLTKLSSEEMKTMEFYNKLNKDNVWFFRNNSYPKLNMEIVNLKETTDINIRNTLKKFDITTEIGLNSENERTGGSITGEYTDVYNERNNIKFVETIDYNYESKEVITIKPDDDYVIKEIKINGELLDFKVNKDGSHTIPEGYFKEVKQNYHIVVIFEKTKDNLIINKVDSIDNEEMLSGAKFKIEQIEDRPQVTNEVGALTGNSGQYNFTQSSGKYLSSNQGKNNTVSNSYIPIDLTNKKGKYNLKVNAEISSELGRDIGYATITTNTSRPTYDSTDGRFIFISGIESAKDYTTILEAGYKYYLHLGYRKNASDSNGTDTFTINNVELSLNTDDFYKNEITTNSNGQIVEKVPLGKYKITELEAPEGYTLNSEPIEVMLIPGNCTITIENSKPIKYEIIKQDKQTKEPIKGAKFAVYSLKDTYEVNDFIKDTKGNYIGNVNSDGIYEIETNEEGKIVLNLAPGLYKAVEVKSAEGYLLEESESERTVFFEIEEPKTEVNSEIDLDTKEDEEINLLSNDEADLVINSIEDLVRFSNEVNSGTSYEGKTVKLAKTLDFNEDSSYNDPTDISFGDYNGDGTTEGIKVEITKENGKGFKPIGVNTSFKGIFDGNNNKIINLYINANGSAIGLFGYIQNAKILNLGITGNSTIKSSGTFSSGAIVGNMSNSIIENCYNTEKIEFGGYIMGGLVGTIADSNSVIKNCYNKGEITLYSGIYVGGIVGNVQNSVTISNCYNTSNLSCTASSMGGIIGSSVTDSNIINCYNTGIIESTNCPTIGGIIGSNVTNSNIKDCYNTGLIVSTGTTNIGGIVGQSVNNSTISNCYNTGLIKNNNSGRDRTNGGIVGYNVEDSNILNCYNTAEISGYNILGGIVAYNVANSNIISCYNEGKMICNYGNAGGIIGNNASNCNISKTHNAGEMVGTAGALCGLVGNNLTNSKVEECYNEGNINNNSTTAGLAYNVTNSKIIDSYNIGDLSTNYAPVGGIGYNVTNSEIINSNNKGTIISNNAPAGGIAYNISSSKVVSFKNTGDINSSSSAAGGLASSISNSKIINSYNAGNITSKNPAGGLACDISYCEVVNFYNDADINVSDSTAGGIASNINDSKIVNSYNTGNITANSPAGGLAYYVSYSEIVNCYNTGIINSSGSVAGGIISNINKSKIINSYNTGNIIARYPAGGIAQNITNSEITNCYSSGTITVTGDIFEGQLGGIANASNNNKITNCYYLNSTATNGIYDTEDVVGQVESKTEEELKSKEFTQILNFNKNNLDSSYTLLNWKQNDELYPILEQIEFKKGNEVTIYNTKGSYNLIINKVDKDTQNKLAGAKFSVENTTNKLNFIGNIESQSEYNFSKYGISGYQSNNYNISDSVASAYYPIDLRSYEGNFNLSVEYSISSQQNSDIGYATITTSTEAPSFDTNNNDINTSYRFIYVSGTANNEIGTVTLKGGKKYYLHIGYRKDGDVNTDQDRFYIHNMDLKYSTEAETTEEGFAQIKVPTGIYNITETKAPLGYELNSTTQQVSILNATEISEITFENTKESTDESYNLIITKKDKNKDEVMPGVKFVILDEDGNYAKDNIGTNVGKKEEIDGQEKYVVTTDENGQIKLKLKLGKYRLIEVQTLEGYAIEDEQEFEITDANETVPVEITITNQKLSKVIVHHYLEGTGEEYENEPVVLAPNEVLEGKVPEEYNTSPNMKIEGYILLKDEQGEYVIPENASGNYTEEVQNVYYYYNRKSLELIVHHYIEGTEDKVYLGNDEQGEYKYAEDEHYYYQEGDHYKTNASEEVLQSYELVGVVGDEEKDITKNEVVTYYYKIKKYNIITRVEIPEGRQEKGGSISGEGQAPYEVVEHGKSSVEDIIITPDKGYRIKQIRLVSTNENGQNTESILYGENVTENAEVSVNNYAENSIILSKFQNMNENKEIIVVFEPDEGRLIVHHYEENTTNKIYEDQIMSGLIGQKVETSPVKVENYVLMQEPLNRTGTITKEVQEKIYYYQRQYKVTTNVIEHSEKYSNGNVLANIKGGSITDEDINPHELILKNRNSTKVIEMIPDEGYEIVKVTINDIDFDFLSMVDENGKLTLPEGFFANVQENKHIEVEFRKKTNVIVKYLEEETEKVLYTTDEGKEYEEIQGYENDKFETSRKIIKNYIFADVAITNENKESITNYDGINTDEKLFANGNMYADTITIIYWYKKAPSGIIVRHIETNEKKEEIEIESATIPGKAGEEVVTNRNEYNKFISVNGPSNDDENIIVVGKDENTKTATYVQDKTLEVWYYYEKQYDVITKVKPHEEKVIDSETGAKITKQVDGGSISKKYEKDEQGNDKIDDQGNKIELTFETILSRGNSKEIIEIKPDDGYQIKSIIKQKIVVINEKEEVVDEEIDIKNFIKEDGSVVLGENDSYLVDVQNDYIIVVEFEKIPAKVIVKYLEDGTEKSLSDEDIKNGNVYDKYQTEPKDINYYELVKEKYPQNSTGSMTKEDIIVKYYYKKLTFNMKIEKEIEKVLLNGNEEIVKVENNKLVKVKIDDKNLSSTTIEIVYKLKVTNTEKVEGRALIEEHVPEGLELVAEKSSKDWTLQENHYVLQTEEIKPQETKEYMVTLKCKPEEENKGEKNNIAKITKTDNVPNFYETTLLDNEDSAKVEIEIKKTEQKPENKPDDKPMQNPENKPVENTEQKPIINNNKDIISNIKTGDTILIYVISLVIAGIVICVIIKTKDMLEK